MAKTQKVTERTREAHAVSKSRAEKMKEGPLPASAADRKRGAWNWIETKKGETWETPLIPMSDWCVASVKRSFSKELDGKYKFYAYRNASVLGRRDTVEAAKKLAESGEADSQDDAVRDYVRNHSLDIPMFLRLTETERRQLRVTFPAHAPAQSRVDAVESGLRRAGVRSAADMSDPGTRKLVEELAAKAASAHGAGVGAPKAAGRTRAVSASDRAAIDLDPAAKMQRARDGNPKKEGSAARKRWDLMFKHCDEGSTVKEYEAAGGNLETLKNAVAKGWARLVTATEGARAPSAAGTTATKPKKGGKK